MEQKLRLADAEIETLREHMAWIRIICTDQRKYAAMRQIIDNIAADALLEDRRDFGSLQ